MRIEPSRVCAPAACMPTRREPSCHLVLTGSQMPNVAPIKHLDPTPFVQRRHWASAPLLAPTGHVTTCGLVGIGAPQLFTMIDDEHSRIFKIIILHISDHCLAKIIPRHNFTKWVILISWLDQTNSWQQELMSHFLDCFGNFPLNVTFQSCLVSIVKLTSVVQEFYHHWSVLVVNV